MKSSKNNIITKGGTIAGDTVIGAITRKGADSLSGSVWYG